MLEFSFNSDFRVVSSLVLKRSDLNLRGHVRMIFYLILLVKTTLPITEYRDSFSKLKEKGFKGRVAYLSYCPNPEPFLNGLKMLVCALF